MPGMKATAAERAAYYRDKAEEARAAADGILAVSRTTLLSMAETYDQLAAHIEGLLRKNRPDAASQ